MIKIIFFILVSKKYLLYMYIIFRENAEGTHGVRFLKQNNFKREICKQNRTISTWEQFILCSPYTDECIQAGEDYWNQFRCQFLSIYLILKVVIL